MAEEMIFPKAQWDSRVQRVKSANSSERLLGEMKQNDRNGMTEQHAEERSASARAGVLAAFQVHPGVELSVEDKLTSKLRLWNLFRQIPQKSPEIPRKLMKSSLFVHVTCTIHFEKSKLTSKLELWKLLKTQLLCKLTKLVFSNDEFN
ncbi:hypothetical protein WN51_04953 [Melipona quadrifasciata]|uniref:Uncharacterized protein n=1 Tax=Melipona quadrifasciata TaxID=166423 RepID=A0A0N0U3S5_9HYME|nr:hypothetical protein WN51_04953 [Melipona quadrifasciata]